MTDLIVYGARGSTPVSGPGYGRYGGNTTCFSTEVASGHYLVIDAGTGLRGLEAALPKGGGLEFTIILTHYHWDHIQGLPMFDPLADSRNRFTFYGRRYDDRDVGDILDGVMRPPWFPVRLRERAAGAVFADLGKPLDIAGIRVTPLDLRHPQGAVGFRLDGPRRSIMIATDHEAGDPRIDAALADLASGVDVLIHDAQYTEDEVAGDRRGWGHSSWAQAAAAASSCGAGRLVLTSHDPNRDDDRVEGLVRLARARFPLTTGAYEGLRLPL